MVNRKNKSTIGYACLDCGKSISIETDKIYEGKCEKCFFGGVQRHVSFKLTADHIALMKAPNFSEAYPLYLAKIRSGGIRQE